jgi:hypothetical protein
MKGEVASLLFPGWEIERDGEWRSSVQVTYATEATPGAGANEDCLVAGPGWVAVLDGATPRPDVVSGCSHGVAWLVRRLAGALAERLVRESGAPLPDLLAEAIEQTRDGHGGGCDLANPDSPSATVALLREYGGRLYWLVLADSPIVLDLASGVTPILDQRVEALPVRTAEAVRAARNSPGGFWVAGTKPEAAHEAVTGSVPAAEARRAAVFSDGGSRLVERFGLLDWAGLLDLTETHGPAEVVRRTRAAEALETPGQRATRNGKQYDDATVVLVHP